MGDETLLVLTTCDDAERAARLAEELVDGRLAACVNLIPGVSSIYRWEGNVEQGREVLLLIKTSSARLALVESTIRARSSYELPEVIAVPITGGSADYLDWVRASIEP